jgi:hypothetical protein
MSKLTCFSFDEFVHRQFDAQGDKRPVLQGIKNINVSQT